MLSRIYQLVGPRLFERVYTDVGFDGDHLIVRPEYLSICNADQRYYQGIRPDVVMREKLPMALIHEACGQVVYDPSGEFAPGDRVVMIPNTPVEEDEFTAENYLRSSRFRASSFDGFMQEYVSLDMGRAVKAPEDVLPEISAFTEFISVARHGIDRFGRFSHDRRERIGVWGDGNLGYVTSLLLKYLYPDAAVFVFGINEYKLGGFSFADGTFVTDQVPSGLELDHCFECVGGGASGAAVNQIISLIKPEGSIALMGVSEEPPPIDTRMVLEKGLRLFGSSRSGRRDFEAVTRLLEREKSLCAHLEKIIGSLTDIRNICDINEAFETDIHKVMGKTIMRWCI